MKEHNRINQSPPLFKIDDVFGNTIRLKDVKSSYILLVFLRYSGCPWCNLAIHRLSLEYAALQKNGCEVIAFVQSEKELILKNIYGRHEVRPPFPIIADKAQRIYKKYDVVPSVRGALKDLTKIPHWVHAVRKHGYKQTQVDGSLFVVPAWFLINNRSHKIIKHKSGVSFYDHETFVDIYDSLIFTD